MGVAPSLPPRGHVISAPIPPGRLLPFRAGRSRALLCLLALAIVAAAGWVVVRDPHRARQPSGRPVVSTGGRPPASSPPVAAAPPQRSGTVGQRPGHAPAARQRTPGGVARPDLPARTAEPAPRPVPSRTLPRPPSAGEEWIKAECARRFPDAARRRACVHYLRQILGR